MTREDGALTTSLKYTPLQSNIAPSLAILQKPIIPSCIRIPSGFEKNLRFGSPAARTDFPLTRKGWLIQIFTHTIDITVRKCQYGGTFRLIMSRPISAPVNPARLH